MTDFAQILETQEGFSFTIDRSLIEQVLKSILPVTEEATFIISPEGIRIFELEPTHVALVDINLSNTSFLKYDVQTEIQVSFRVKTLLDLVRSFLKKEVITFEPSEGNKLRLSCKELEYNVYTISRERTSNDLKLPTANYNVQVKADTGIWQKEFKRMAKLSGYITLKASDTIGLVHVMALLKSDGIDSKMMLAAQENIKITEESQSTYSLEWINSMFKTLDPKSAFEMYFATSKPIKFITRLDNISTMNYHLAPYLEN